MTGRRGKYTTSRARSRCAARAFIVSRAAPCRGLHYSARGPAGRAAAHDGTRAYCIDSGLYRLVCRNGLVVADAHFAHVAIRHFDVSAEKFADAAHSVVESTPRVLETVARWQSVQLTELAQHEFARRAAVLRWRPDQPIVRLLVPEALLKPARYGDDKPDLWTCFNRVQEHLIRGTKRRTISHDEPRLRLRVRSGTVFTSTDEPTEEDLAYAQAGMVTIIRIAGHHSMATPLDGARAALLTFVRESKRGRRASRRCVISWTENIFHKP